MKKAKHSNELLDAHFNKLFANNTLQKPLIFAFDEVDSTNTEAKLFAEGRPTDDKRVALFFTRTQRAGRGTRMRTFESPRDGGLYMSLLLYPNEDAFFATRITMITAVVVCRVIGRLLRDNATARIKWVNDITINDQKLAGILTEARLDERGRTGYVIIGIGVNLTPSLHSDEVRKIMTSLAEHGVKISPEELAALITEEFLLATKSKEYKFIDEYRRLSSVIGRQVNVIAANESFSATVLEIADDGAIIVRREDGRKERLISADVSIRAITTTKG